MELPSQHSAKKRHVESAERARAKRKAETEEQKNEWLRKRNASDRARKLTETPVEKQSRFDKRNSLLLNEICGQRAARLEHMSSSQQQRLEAKTPQQKVARLE